MTLHVSIGGANKRVRSIWVSVGGVWKRVLKGHTSVSAAFKLFFDKFYAKSATWAATEFTIGTYASPTFTFYNNGQTGEITQGDQPDWLDPIESGAGAGFYMHVLQTSGGTSNETGSARNTMLSVSSSRFFGFNQTTWGNATRVYTVRIYRYNGVSPPVYGVDTPVATGTMTLTADSEP